MTIADTEQEQSRAQDGLDVLRMPGGIQVRRETLILLTSAVVLMLLGGILTIFVRGDELLPGELEITRWLIRLDADPVLLVSEFLDYISENEVAPVVFVILLPVVWILFGRRALILFGISGSLTAFTVITNLADRARPTPDLRFEEIVKESGIYPSGHVFFGILVFGMIGYIAWKQMRPGILRTAAVTLMAAIAILMGPSRVIELDHWPADTFGSYLLATPFFLVLIWLDRHPVTQPGGWVHGIFAAGKRVEDGVRRRLYSGRH